MKKRNVNNRLLSPENIRHSRETPKTGARQDKSCTFCISKSLSASQSGPQDHGAGNQSSPESRFTFPPHQMQPESPSLN